MLVSLNYYIKIHGHYRKPQVGRSVNNTEQRFSKVPVIGDVTKLTRRSRKIRSGKHTLTLSSVSILFLDHPRTSFLRNISRQWFWIFNHVAESSQCRKTIIIVDTYAGYNRRMSAHFAILCMMPILNDIWFSIYSIIYFNIYIYLNLESAEWVLTQGL